MKVATVTAMPGRLPMPAPLLPPAAAVMPAPDRKPVTPPWMPANTV